MLSYYKEEEEEMEEEERRILIMEKDAREGRGKGRKKMRKEEGGGRRREADLLRGDLEEGVAEVEENRGDIDDETVTAHLDRIGIHLKLVLIP